MRKGLLLYSVYAHGKLVALILFGALIAGIVSIFVEFDLLHNWYPLIALGAAPYTLLMKSEGTANWEKFQLTMPIKRKDLATSLYLNVFFASFVGIPVLALIWGMKFVMDANFADFILNVGLVTAMSVFGALWSMTGLLYSLAYTKLGKASEQALFIVCFIASAALVGALVGAGSALELSGIVTSVLIAAVGMAVFLVGLFATRRLYAKMDF